MRLYLKFFKRPFDIIMSLVGLIVSIPLWIIIPVAILREDGRPVFFCDTRLSKNGRIFKQMKFRSMIKNVEEKLGVFAAVKDDPRVTKIGKFLRRTAFDELPQILNILKGDMSFVGPRPEKDVFAQRIQSELSNYNLRHTIRPGLTGMAQVYKKYDSPEDEKLYYDLEYVKNASLFLDLKLLFLSLFTSLRLGWEKFEDR